MLSKISQVTIANVPYEPIPKIVKTFHKFPPRETTVMNVRDVPGSGMS